MHLLVGMEKAVPGKHGFILLGTNLIQMVVLYLGMESWNITPTLEQVLTTPFGIGTAF